LGAKLLLEKKKRKGTGGLFYVDAKPLLIASADDIISHKIFYSLVQEIFIFKASLDFLFIKIHTSVIHISNKQGTS